MKINYSTYILFSLFFVFSLFNFSYALEIKADYDTGRLSDKAIVNENEPALMIDTGGPSFIRGDKFVGEIDPNFIPPKQKEFSKDEMIFTIMFSLVCIVLAYFIFRKIGWHRFGIKSILVFIAILVLFIFFIYSTVKAWTPLSSTTCALNNQSYSSWEALTSAVASSGYCSGGSGYVTGGSSNRPSSYSWKCTGWQNGAYVVTDSCSVTSSGTSSGGGTASNCL